MFQAQNRETINSIRKSCCVLRDHYDEERDRIVFGVSQNNTRPARPRPQCARPRPIFWSQTGLVLRPTVSDHITAQQWHIRVTAWPEPKLLGKGPTPLTFKLCVMVYRCLHGIGPEYFSEDFKLVSEIQSCQRLRSASSTDVVVPATRRSSLGDRAFPVAGTRAWNALPPSVTSAPSLSSFWRLLKTFLFQRQLRQQH